MLLNPGSGANVSDLSVAQLRQLHKKRLQKMLSIAKKEKEEVLILGAFGCQIGIERAAPANTFLLRRCAVYHSAARICPDKLAKAALTETTGIPKIERLQK